MSDGFTHVEWLSSAKVESTKTYDHVPVYVGNQPKALCNHRGNTHTHSTHEKMSNQWTRERKHVSIRNDNALYRDYTNPLLCRDTT